MKSGKAALKTARQLFRLCFKEGSLDGATVLKVVRRYGEDKPRGYLGILSSFQRLVRLEVEKSRCVVESGTELDAAAKKEIEADLRKKYGKHISVEFRLEPALVAGLRIRMGNDVWDGSVANRLERLRQQYS